MKVTGRKRVREASRILVNLPHCWVCQLGVLDSKVAGAGEIGVVVVISSLWDMGC